MFFPKLLANRLFLLLISFIVVAIIGALMFHEVQLLLSSLQVAELMALKEDEESTAILLVGFGVLLEGRHILQNWVAGEEVESSETTHKCEYYGFILLSLGLFTEIFDQITNLVGKDEFLYWTEIFINYPINIYAMYLLTKVMVYLADAESDIALTN